MYAKAAAGVAAGAAPIVVPAADVGPVAVPAPTPVEDKAAGGNPAALPAGATPPRPARGGWGRRRSSRRLKTPARKEREPGRRTQHDRPEGVSERDEERL